MTSSASEKPVSQGENTAGEQMSTWKARMMADKIAKGDPVDYPTIAVALHFLLDDHFKLLAEIERYEKEIECSRQLKHAIGNFLGRAPAVSSEPLDNSNVADES